MKRQLIFGFLVSAFAMISACDQGDDDPCAAGTGNEWDIQNDKYDPYFPYDGSQKTLSYRFQDSNKLTYDIEFKLKSHTIMDTVAGSPYSSCDTSFREITRLTYTSDDKSLPELAFERNVASNFSWREPYYEYSMGSDVYFNPDLIQGETKFYDSLVIGGHTYYKCFRRLNRTRLSTSGDLSTHAEVIYNEEYGFIKIDDPARRFSYQLNP